MRREPEVPEERVSVVECLDGFARITLKELAPIHSVKNDILQKACSTSPRVVADMVKSALMRIDKLKNSQAKSQERMVTTKSVVAMLKSTRQLGCVFQDMEPPKSSSILRKSSDVRKPIRCVKFTKASARHTKIRDKILRSDTFAQVNFISAAPPLRKKRNGNCDTPVKQRGGWPKVF